MKFSIRSATSKQLTILVAINLFFFQELQAQERYVDPVFSKIVMDTYTYADTLKLDFYHVPNDTITDKPLLLLVHGGGFGSGKKNNPLEKKFCIDMAQRGYATASMSYRLTRKGKSFDCGCPTSEKIVTFLSASEDILKAARFLMDKANTLKFDATSLILVGSSAGAEAVLNTIFMQHQYQFRELPYGDLSFAAVISFSGAVLDAEYITKNTAVPAMMFHGVKDNLVPFATAAHHYCDEGKPGFIMLDGSRSIADRLQDLNIPYTLVYDNKGNHDWANLSYRYTDIISNFIKKTVVDKEQIQSEINFTLKK